MLTKNIQHKDKVINFSYYATMFLITFLASYFNIPVKIINQSDKLIINEFSSILSKESQIKKHMDIGDYAHDTNNFGEAIYYYTKAIELDNNNHVAHCHRGVTYALHALFGKEVTTKAQRKELYQKGLNDVNKALTLVPKDSDQYKDFSKKLSVIEEISK